MTTNRDMWQIFEAERGTLADALATQAEEFEERNKRRNARRRISRAFHLAKRQRSRLGLNLPKKIGPKRVHELRTTLQYELLKRIFAREQDIAQRGIEAVLNEMLLEYPPRCRKSERAAAELISKNIIRVWLQRFSARAMRPMGEPATPLWNKSAIRAELHALRRLATSALRALPQRPKSRAEWSVLDRANAEFAVLSRLLEMAGFGTRDEFIRVCDEIYQNPLVLRTCVSLPYYQASWQNAVFRLKADMTRRYGDGEAPPVSEGVARVPDVVKPDAVTPSMPAAPSPEEATQAFPVQETIRFELDGTTVKPWEDYVTVLGDEYERKLVGRYVPLSKDIDNCLYDVRRCEDPKILGAALKMAITALNSMMKVTAALDEHRRGKNEVIVLSLDGKTAIAEPVPQALLDADQFLGDFLMLNVNDLDELIDHCRNEAKLLQGRSETDEARDRPGGVNKQGWKREFLELACFITGEAARFTKLIKSRHTRVRHPISAAGRFRDSGQTCAQKNLGSGQGETLQSAICDKAHAQDGQTAPKR